MPARSRAQLLSLADIAEQYALAPATVRTYNGKAAVARRNGTARGHDFPPPVDRIGNSPLFDAEAVRAWFDHRPGRGAGGGRPRKSRSDDTDARTAPRDRPNARRSSPHPQGDP